MNYNETAGHYLRRGIHLSLAFIPIIYYWWGEKLAQRLDVNLQLFIVFLAAGIVLLDGIRLWRGWVVWGQRQYEAKQISAFAWGSIGIAVVLLFAPQYGYQGAAFGLPLIWAMALADPFMGELRKRSCNSFLIIGAGLLVVSLVWLFAYFYLGAPLWLLPLIVPITVAAEWVRVPWVDDNFTILIVPLLLILILWYSF